MISSLAGFAVTRAIPSQYLVGVLTGSLKLCGGVIRDNSGKIVAHLVNGGLNPLGVVDVVLNGVNAFQLHRIGKDIKELQESVAALQAATSQIVTLAKGTMLMSGLTLAVSAAGFVFLGRKLSKIDETLKSIAGDVKAVRKFLELQERARLQASLRTMDGIDEYIEESTRAALLVSARQTLSEINQRYRELLVNVQTLEELMAVEEYFAVTALGQALSSAELDMRKQPVADLRETYQTWLAASRTVVKEVILKDSPERFLDRRYAGQVRTDEIVDWLDFTHATDRHLDWIDDLRAGASWKPDFSRRLSGRELNEVNVMRRLVARNRVFEGYIAQYELLALQGVRPSKAQAYFDSIAQEDRVEGCLLLVAS